MNWSVATLGLDVSLLNLPSPTMRIHISWRLMLKVRGEGVSVSRQGKKAVFTWFVLVVDEWVIRIRTWFQVSRSYAEEARVSRAQLKQRLTTLEFEVP